MKILVILAVAVGIARSNEVKEEVEEEIQLGTVIGIDLGTTYSW